MPRFRLFSTKFLLLSGHLSLALLAPATALGAIETSPATLPDAASTEPAAPASLIPQVPLKAAAAAQAGPSAIKLPPWDEAAFPHYPQLKPAISFWTRVFGEYSENQSVLHSDLHPSKIFTVLDFRSDAVTLDAASLARKRSKEEKSAKEHYNKLLQQVHDLRHSTELMTGEQRKIFDLYADQSSNDRRFAEAVGTIRAQRGLKERTLLALNTAEKYLPHMESTFSSYRLPLPLTRLPLVESSFNVEAYSKVGAAGLWQFMPSSAKIYMRLNEVVDDRRDPWTSTDGAARHLRDDYNKLGSWPLALTAYNHGRGGVSRGMEKTGSRNLPELIERYQHKNFGFASRNFYAEFLAANDVERAYRSRKPDKSRAVLAFDTVETRHYVPYDTLRRLCGADDDMFRKLNPAYRPEVIKGQLYVPPGHVIRVPAGQAKSFAVGYEKLSSNERFSTQKSYYQLHRVKKGEVLGRIAKKYNVSTRSVLAANGMKDAKRLRVGQVLKIPPHLESRPGPVTVAIGESKPAQTRVQKVAAARSKDAITHKVKLGQTLSSIARRYKVSVASLREANELGDSSHIRPGMKLKVPTKS